MRRIWERRSVYQPLCFATLGSSRKPDRILVFIMLNLIHKVLVDTDLKRKVRLQFFRHITSHFVQWVVTTSYLYMLAIDCGWLVVCAPVLASALTKISKGGRSNKITIVIVGVVLMVGVMQRQTTLWILDSSSAVCFCWIFGHHTME